MEGKNIVIEYRYAEGKLDRLPALAAELVRLKVDVIVTGGPTATRAAKEATTTIPIVMAQDGDPVGNGFVASLARPGGNITGLSTLAPELSGKRLELLKEIVPKLSRVAVFGTSTEPGQRTNVKRDGTRRRGVEGAASIPRRTRVPRILRLHSEPQARGVLRQSLCWAGAVFNSQRKQIADLAVKSRLPAIYTSQNLWKTGAYDLRGEHYRLVPARRYLCGQDFERRQAGRSAGGAAEEIRVRDQSESREADRPDDSAERAGEGG